MTALVLAEVRNRTGHITLNRPAAYNAINLDMTGQILEQLRAWADDGQILAVVLRATGDKAFCAGGDIRELYDSHLGGTTVVRDFFREEYILDQLIHDYPKPLLALAEGLVLGGGMGLFQGAMFRVITGQARLGMPEVSIGYFPDVGGSYFLSRLQGELGTYLGITGNMVNAADALYTGLADHLVEQNKIAELDAALDRMDWQQQQPAAAIRTLLQSLSSPAPANGVLEQARPAIDRHFSFSSMDEIVQSLASEQNPAHTAWAQETLSTLQTRSPMSMVTTLRMLRQGHQLSLEQCFALEQALIAQWFDRGDFIEGVRAQIVDKDKQPRWKYASLDAVPAEEIDALFAAAPTS